MTDVVTRQVPAPATPAGGLAPTAPPRRRFRLRGGPWVSYAVMVAFLAVWQIAANTGWWNPSLFSSPANVVRAGWELNELGLLYDAVKKTFISLVFAMILSIVLGEIIGLVLGRVERIRNMFEWFFVILNSMPRLAFIPPIILLLKIGYESRVAIGFLSAVVPIALFVSTGVQQVSPTLVQMARSFQVKGPRLWQKVIIPASLPHLLGGLRLGFSRAMLGVIVTELYNPKEGIGSIMEAGRRAIDPSWMIFVALLVGVIGMLGIQAISAVQRKVVKT